MSKEKIVSLIIIILINLVPVAGVFWWSWSIFMTIMLFWFESVIIGILNVVKILFAGKEGGIKFFLAPFFVVHYNIFMLVQGLFIVVLIGKQDLSTEESFGNAIVKASQVWYLSSFVKGVAAIFLIHLVLVIKDYFISKMYLLQNSTELMFEPYKRVFVQQIMIIVGAYLLIAFNSSMVFLILLVVLKTLVDLHQMNKAKNKEITITLAENNKT